MKLRLIDKIKQGNRNGILGSVAALVSGNLLGTIIGVVCTLVQGRYVTADLLGYYRQFSILSGYLFILHLGSYQALERIIPLCFGKGESEKAKEYTAVGYSWILFSTVILGVIFSILCINSLIHHDFKAAVAWFSQFLISANTLISGILSSTYRSSKDFKNLAKANAFGAAAALISIPVLIINPFMGLVVRSVSGIAVLIPLLRHCPIKVRPKFQFGLFKEMLKQGLPLFAASYITGVGIDTLRNTLVLSYMSREGLGYWSFSFMIYTMILTVPSSILAVLNPRIIQDYGKEKDLLAITKKYRWSGIQGSLLMFIMALAGAVIIKIFVPLILPNYTNAVPVIISLMPCLVVKPLEVYSVMLLAANDLKWINIIAVLSVGIQLLGIIILKNVLGNLYVFPIALFIGALAKIILTVLRLGWLKHKEFG